MRPQEKSLKIWLISDFQLGHVGVTGRTLGLAHFPEKGTSEAPKQLQKILIKLLKSKSITQSNLTHGLTRGISSPGVKIYTRLTQLSHRGANSSQEPPNGGGDRTNVTLVTHRACSSPWESTGVPRSAKQYPNPCITFLLSITLVWQGNGKY